MPLREVESGSSIDWEWENRPNFYSTFYIFIVHFIYLTCFIPGEPQVLSLKRFILRLFWFCLVSHTGWTLTVVQVSVVRMRTAGWAQVINRSGLVCAHWRSPGWHSAVGFEREITGVTQTVWTGCAGLWSTGGAVWEHWGALRVVPVTQQASRAVSAGVECWAPGPVHAIVLLLWCPLWSSRWLFLQTSASQTSWDVYHTTLHPYNQIKFV